MDWLDRMADSQRGVANQYCPFKILFPFMPWFSTRDSEPRNEKHSMDDFLQPGLGRWQARLLQPSALTAFSNRLLQPLFQALTAFGALTAHEALTASKALTARLLQPLKLLQLLALLQCLFWSVLPPPRRFDLIMLSMAMTQPILSLKKWHATFHVYEHIAKMSKPSKIKRCF